MFTCNFIVFYYLFFTIFAPVNLNNFPRGIYMAEEAEVKSTEEVKPQETKSQEKSQVKKAPSKKKRPFNGKRKGGAPAAAKKPAVLLQSSRSPSKMVSSRRSRTLRTIRRSRPPLRNLQKKSNSTSLKSLKMLRFARGIFFYRILEYQKRDFYFKIQLSRNRIDNKSVGQGWGGCREGPVRPSQLRAGAPPA